MMGKASREHPMAQVCQLTRKFSRGNRNVCTDLFSFGRSSPQLAVLQSTGHVANGKITLVFILRFDFMIEPKRENLISVI